MPFQMGELVAKDPAEFRPLRVAKMLGHYDRGPKNPATDRYIDPFRDQQARQLQRITGYTTGLAFFAHSVAKTSQGLVALIGAAREFGGPGFLLPTRNHEVFTWCLKGGLRLVYQMTLMTIGLYNEPTGAYLPSVLY